MARPGLDRRTADALRELVVRPEYGSTTDAVTDALREAIVSGMLVERTWLREVELAHHLRVSRTPVREALRRLSDEGLTERIANRGSRVAPLSPSDLIAVYTVREMLEALVARRAAERRDPEIVAELARVHRAMVEADPDDIPALAQLNLLFHRLIREGSGNHFLERQLQQVESTVRRFPIVAYSSPESARRSHGDHGAILRAIAAGDGDAAERAASRHMRRIRDMRLAQIAEDP